MDALPAVAGAVVKLVLVVWGGACDLTPELGRSNVLALIRLSLCFMSFPADLSKTRATVMLHSSDEEDEGKRP